MSVKDLEKAILVELQSIAQNPNLRLKDMAEWQTGRNLQPHGDETLWYLPVLKISVSVRARK